MYMVFICFHNNDVVTFYVDDIENLLLNIVSDRTLEQLFTIFCNENYCTFSLYLHRLWQLYLLSIVVGINRGINFVVATYDSNHKSEFVSGKAIKQKRANYSKFCKELQIRQTPSSRGRIKAIGQRENRWMQDINHQVSNALLESYPKHTLFVLEDLSGIRNATECVKTKDRYVSVSWSFYDLERKLIYKAKQSILRN